MPDLPSQLKIIDGNALSEQYRRQVRDRVASLIQKGRPVRLDAVLRST